VDDISVSQLLDWKSGSSFRCASKNSQMKAIDHDDPLLLRTESTNTSAITAPSIQSTTSIVFTQNENKKKSCNRNIEVCY
jgi:hypothetical protein